MNRNYTPVDVTTVSGEPYVNLVAGIFASTRSDWETSYNILKELGGEEEAKEQWKIDQKWLTKNKELKEENHYKVIKKRSDRYIKASKLRNEVNNFLKSEWFEGLCAFCELDSSAVREHFTCIKDQILNS